MYWLIGIGGLALMAAPYGLGYSTDTPALWVSLIPGIIVVLASYFKIGDQNGGRWEYWVAGIAGLLVVIAPFVLNFSALVTATWTNVILGAAITVLASYGLVFARAQTQAR